MKTRNQGVRIFKDRVCETEAEALRWALDMELNHGWTVSRISTLCGGLYVALVWKWR